MVRYSSVLLYDLCELSGFIFANLKVRSLLLRFGKENHISTHYQLSQRCYFLLAEAGHQADFRYRIPALFHKLCRFECFLVGTTGFSFVKGIHESGG